ncbi:MAG: D-aminoacyl-tRNA deacylase [Crocinitomicaceae bacterium]
MKVVIQRVSEASVQIGGVQTESIKQGYVLLLGYEIEDNNEDITWMTSKIINLRLFSDENNLMNLSIKDIEGEILCISQFTLHARTKKGNRPSFIQAAKPEISVPLYENTIVEFEKLLPSKIRTGQFGADMKVSLINDGPVTIIIDSKNKQ